MMEIAERVLVPLTYHTAERRAPPDVGMLCLAGVQLLFASIGVAVAIGWVGHAFGVAAAVIAGDFAWFVGALVAIVGSVGVPKSRKRVYQLYLLLTVADCILSLLGIYHWWRRPDDSVAALAFGLLLGHPPLLLMAARARRVDAAVLALAGFQLLMLPVMLPRLVWPIGWAWAGPPTAIVSCDAICVSAFGFIVFTAIGLIAGLKGRSRRAGWLHLSLVGGALCYVAAIACARKLDRSLDAHGLWLGSFDGDRYYVPTYVGGVDPLAIALNFAAANPLTILLVFRLIAGRAIAARARPTADVPDE